MNDSQADKAKRFLELHRRGEPLLMPNAWDLGSAALLVSLGFQALATTSSGHAATRGRADGGVTRDEALAHAGELAGGTDVPVSADLENAFADQPAGVAETIALAVETGLAGASVEDYARGADDIYEMGLARERVAAAADAAHSGPVRLVLTARAENLIRGKPDLADTIARLVAYQEAGADVLFAPGLSKPDDIREVLEAVDAPVSVLAVPGAPSVSELAALGVARISVGGAFAFAAYGGLLQAAEELCDQGTYGYLERAAAGSKALRKAFARS